MYLTRHFGFSGGVDYIHGSKYGLSANTIRVIAGPVFAFGHAGGRSAGFVQPRVPMQADWQAPAEQFHAIAPRQDVVNRGAVMVLRGVGISVMPTANNKGAQIAEVAPTGALSGLHPGDIVNSVNGSEVRTPMDLANVLSGLPSGSQAKLGVIIRGMWQTETTIVLGNR